MSHLQHLQRGSFLREAAAVQRANTGGTHRLAEITFTGPEGPDDVATAVVTTSAGTTVRLVTASVRDELYTALMLSEGGWTAPAADAITPPPATTPPLLVYADLLTDVGEHLFLMTTYPADVGRPDLADARLNAVRLTGDSSVAIELTALGSTHRMHIALDSGIPLGVIPLVIAELLMTLPRNLRTRPAMDWDYPISGR